MLRFPRQALVGEKMKNAFEPWVGRVVLVRVALGKVKLSLLGTLLKNRSETLLVRPKAGSDVEIPKMNVLAIEEAGYRHGLAAFALLTLPRQDVRNLRC